MRSKILFLLVTSITAAFFSFPIYVDHLFWQGYSFGDETTINLAIKLGFDVNKLHHEKYKNPLFHFFRFENRHLACSVTNMLQKYDFSLDTKDLTLLYHAAYYAQYIGPIKFPALRILCEYYLKNGRTDEISLTIKKISNLKKMQRGKYCSEVIQIITDIKSEFQSTGQVKPFHSDENTPHPSR